jgi:protoheme IX farnesyltransferase
MQSNDQPSQPRSSRWFDYLLLAALIATFFLMSAGTIVRVENAGQGCPDWPTCYGGWGMPEAFEAQIQYAHRALTVVAGLLIGAAAAVAVSRFRTSLWVTLPLLFAVALLPAQVLIGQALVLGDEAGWRSGVHTSLALLTLVGLTVSTVSAFMVRYQPGWRPRFSFQGGFTRLAGWAVLAIFVLMISGTVVAVTNAADACPGWPLCGGGLPQTPLAWVSAGHRLLTLLAAGLVLAVFLSAWRSQRSQKVQLTAATAAFILLLGQSGAAAAMANRNFSADLVGVHAISAVALLVVQVVVFVSAGFAKHENAGELAGAAAPLTVRGVARRTLDFVLLSKPIIVALLLVTTYAGMVVGGGQIPSLSLTFWTMLGGALAAGGSSALNQYIDRNVDGAMQRTAKRPLPDGRLTPAEALAYGLGAVLLSFYLLVTFVNLLAALLSLAGMVYYVLLYSVWLKHATVQNIVIGGGAGAIPPLVGWAAASGSLNIPSLFLFAIVFLWTPPHFWALALVRKKDYARAGVPMLPVIQGEAVTRKQIFIYTLELVALTLLMPLFKITGSLFLISAVLLGAWLISTAYRVLRHGGNKVAWKMYRYSSMYLAFLFLALVLDVLI